MHLNLLDHSKGPFRVSEVLETGLVMHTVDHPMQTIHVAYIRVRHYPDSISDDEVWPTLKAQGHGTESKRDNIPWQESREDAFVQAISQVRPHQERG